MHELNKFKHSKRLQQKQNHIKKQQEIAESLGFPIKEPHFLAKRHALNCGNSKCIMCGNPRKFFKERTIKEKSFDQTVTWDS